ncbi:MAG: hypothetical protein EHM89_00255 [Acidobacteria bacterium]|nr:MAG: hypothetical protein EHM89_00255 [Acidobacteriota bacterium]
MTTFAEDEASAEDSEPREFCDITYGDVEHRIAFGIRDLQVDSVLYTATPAARGEVGVNASGDTRELVLTLPIDHALPTRYTQQGIPPKKITVTLWRKQVVSGEIERLWVGDITSMACDDKGTEATFRVPSRAGEMLLRVIPNVTVGRNCPHILYDTMCRIERAGSNPDAIPYMLTTTVLHVSGRDIRVELSNVPAADANRAEWAVNGEVVHVATGERMTIRTQTDLNPGVSMVCDLSMQMQIVGLVVGDDVEIYAGCMYDVETCRDKFDNRLNFGGFPHIRTSTPFLAQGYGLREIT